MEPPPIQEGRGEYPAGHPVVRIATGALVTAFVAMFVGAGWQACQASRAACKTPPWSAVADQVFLHEPGRYSFLLHDATGAGLHLYTPPHWRTSVLLVREDQRYGAGQVTIDVAELPPISFIDSPHECRYNVVVYLPAGTGLDGAGWGHGKFGRGQTEEVR